MALLDLEVQRAVAGLQPFQLLHAGVVLVRCRVGSGGVREDEAAWVHVLRLVVVAQDIDEVLVPLHVIVEALADFLNAILHV